MDPRIRVSCRSYHPVVEARGQGPCHATSSRRLEESKIDVYLSRWITRLPIFVAAVKLGQQVLLSKAQGMKGAPLPYSSPLLQYGKGGRG